MFVLILNSLFLGMSMISRPPVEEKEAEDANSKDMSPPK